MARADWGGADDYSGVFANLNELFESRVEQATARAVRQAEEERAAEDADTYDKWKNGILTDEAWLDYVRVRQEESKGDPKEFAEWTKTLREHETGIRDAQTEAAFESGEISIHAAIGYYRDRLEGMAKNSPEYREVASRLGNLTENRDSEQIYDEAEAIIDRIERGRALYGELLSYYQNKLSGLNPNSDLYRQVKREVNSIRDIVDAVSGGSGGSGGGGGGRGGRSGGSGGGSGGGTPLSGDIDAQINEMIVTFRRGGSLYDPTAPDPILRFQQYNIIEDVDDLEKALENDRDTIQALVEYEENNPMAQTLVDQWGNEYANTPAFKHQLDDMQIRTLEQKWALKMLDGDADGASKELLRLGTHINDHMQRHNSDNMRPAWDKQVSNAMGVLQTAGLEADPDKQMAIYRQASKLVTSFVDRATTKTTFSRGNEITAEDDTPIARVKRTKSTLAREVLPDDKLQEEMMWFNGFFGAAAGKGLDSPDAILEALSDLNDNRPENLNWTKEEITKLVAGDDSDNTRMGIVDTYDSAVGLRDGSWQYYAEGPVMRPRRVEDIELARQEAESNDSRLVATFDKGKLVWRPVEPPDKVEAMWVDKDNQPMSAMSIENLGLQGLNDAEMRGDIKRVQAPVRPWGKVTMSDGKVWYIDSVTNLFYKRMPVRYNYDKTGNIIYDDTTGQPSYRHEPFAHAKGVIAPFAGMTPKEAQKLLGTAYSMGMIDYTSFFTRDENGNATYENPTMEGMYWSQTDDIAKEAMAQQYRTWRAKEQGDKGRVMGPPMPDSFMKKRRPKIVEDDLAWEKRMLMSQRAESENFREQARLAATAPDDEAGGSQSINQFASGLGISIGGNRAAPRDPAGNRFQLAEDRRPATPMPPVSMAPVAANKPAELPRLAMPMANSVEMIDRRDPPRIPQPKAKAPIKAPPKKAPAKKLAGNRRPIAR